MRKAWVQVNGELIPKEDYSPHSGLIIMPDIKPYRSTVTGEEIGSRSRHREYLKRHNLVEIGNEKIKPKQMPDVPGLRDDLRRVLGR